MAAKLVSVRPDFFQTPPDALHSRLRSAADRLVGRRAAVAAFGACGLVLLVPEKLMSRKRRSYEAGHKPKLLVVIDDTQECDRAVYFASRRAARIGGNVVMLRVTETHDQSQQWLGVADIMRAEAREEADAELGKYAARATGIAGITPEQVVREGDKAEEILRVIDQDEDIFILVLAAGIGSDGPGPLVATIGRTAGDYPIPVAIVPGHLTDEEIDALS
jgi:nucleotide-binding universal stress UspA family protein